jgi:hypothetical protein
MTKDYPLEIVKPLIGKTISEIKHSFGDEGFTIIFTDGAILDFGFSGAEGSIQVMNTERKR